MTGEALKHLFVDSREVADLRLERLAHVLEPRIIGHSHRHECAVIKAGVCHTQQCRHPGAKRAHGNEFVQREFLARDGAFCGG